MTLEDVRPYHYSLRLIQLSSKSLFHLALNTLFVRVRLFFDSL